jgi:hypothetical protein
MALCPQHQSLPYNQRSSIAQLQPVGDPEFPHD